MLFPDLSGCEQLKLIDESAFYGVIYTYDLDHKEFKLPNSLSGDGKIDGTTGIRRKAFAVSPNLYSINIPDKLTKIQESTFEGCTRLYKVTTTENSELKEIDKWAFRRCTSLPNTDFLKVLPKLKSIGELAFAECFDIDVGTKDAYDVYEITSGLTSISLPNSLESIGKCAFANNYGVESITMGNNITEIPESAFALKATTTHSTDDFRVTGISDINYANLDLCNSGQLKNVTLSNKLTTIGIEAFRHNTHLVNVTYNGYEGAAEQESNKVVLPTSVKNIGDYAFADCARWQVTIDGNADGEVTDTDYRTDGIDTVDLRSLNLETFGVGVFENDCMLSTAILPADLETIPSRLFCGCGNSITKLNKGTNKQEIKLYGLESVTFPENVKTISTSAFEGCKNFIYKGDTFPGKDAALNNITLKLLPESLETIGERAFYGCQNIGNIAFDSNVTSIGASAFAECSVLYLNPEDPQNNTSFEPGFGLTAVNFKLAKQLKEIGAGAFSLSAIDTADLSDNTLLTSISENTFARCYNLISSQLPESVTQVYGGVYSYGVSLKSVQLPAIATVSDNIFSGISADSHKYYGDFSKVKITMTSQESTGVIKVPIGKEIQLDFIKSRTPNYNHYTDVQRGYGNVLREKDELFVTCDKKDTGDVWLSGKIETPDNSKLSITNDIEFVVYNYNSLTPGPVTLQKPLSKDYDLTVSDVWAGTLEITKINNQSGNTIASVETDDNNNKVLNISSNYISADDTGNILIAVAGVTPKQITKAPVWGSDDESIISVDPIDPDDEKVIDAVNSNNMSQASIRIKKIGTTKLWVADRNDAESKVKAEVTVNVVYPVDTAKTTVSVGTLESDTDSFELEEGSGDKITVVPGYSEEAEKAGAASQAKIYFKSEDPAIASIDRETGEITANKTGITGILIYDDTGTLIKPITINVVEEGALTPNLIKISPEKRIDVYQGSESSKITAKVFPEDENVSQEVVWSLGSDPNNIITSNEFASIETKDNGVFVTGKALGDATLYAFAKDKTSVSSNIAVNVAVPAKTLKFQKSSVSIPVDTNLVMNVTTEESDSFTLLYLPADAHKDKVTWKIEDESIAQFVDTTNRVTLANGVPVIKGIKQGKTKLIATTGTGLIASLNISVFKPVTEFSVDEKRTVHIGESFDLKVNKTPADSSEPFTYVSSNLEIATVDANGKVKGIKEGTVVISAINSRNEARACTVSVVSKVAQITILDAPIEIAVEGVYTIGRASEDPAATIGYRLTPNSIDELTWTSSDSNVASVESGNGAVSIKGVGPGTAVITAKSFSGASATINVSVVSVNTELKFTEESKRIAIGTQAAVTVNKTPADATESIVYTSSNEEIATVDQNGVVTAKAKGDVTIYAKGKVSNVTAGIPVTVTVPATSIKAITHFASEKKIYLVKGSTYQFRYRILPEDTTDTVKFTTSKKKVATVAEDGTITAKKKGSATITVKTESGKIAKIKVYVVNKEKNAKKIKKISTSSIKVGKTVRLKYTVTSATTTNSVTYSVNKPEIATIDEFGYITGLKKGKVKVTVTMSNGKQKTKTIKVKK